MARSYVCSISFMAYSTCVLDITSVGFHIATVYVHSCTHLRLLKITQEAQLHVRRKVRIRTILGFSCANLGS